MTIQLHQFPPMLGVPNASPFCLKLETWLRLAGLPYDVVHTSDPRGGPMGKLPYIVDGGTVVADSSLIIAHLTRTRGVRLDAQLDPGQRAGAHAFGRMIEEHLYWAIVYARWIDEAGWNAIRPVYFAPIPAPLRGLVARMARRGVQRDLHGHGLGRQSRAEIYARAGADIDALAVALGDQPYFFGGEPTTIDAVLYGFVANCWQAHLDTPLKALVARHDNLTAHCTRMSGRCFARAAS